jgi:hypothetical protein
MRRRSGRQIPAAMQVAAAQRTSSSTGNVSSRIWARSALGIGNDPDANLSGTGLWAQGRCASAANVFADARRGSAILAGGVRRGRAPSRPAPEG